MSTTRHVAGAGRQRGTERFLPALGNAASPPAPTGWDRWQECEGRGGTPPWALRFFVVWGLGPQNVPPWHTDYFELESIKAQKPQEVVYLLFPGHIDKETCVGKDT